MAFDLVLQGGRVIDPSQDLDATLDVAFSDGHVAQTGTGLIGKETRNVTGAIVTPGLIDLHTHVYWGGTSLGVDPTAAAEGRLHDPGGYGKRGAGQLSGVSRTRHQTVGAEDHRVPQCFIRRHLRLFPARDGWRKRRSPADGADRRGGGRSAPTAIRSRASRFASVCTPRRIPEQCRWISRARWPRRPDCR